MKKITFYSYVLLAILGVACSSQLDINDNPNQATAVTADLILPQALVATASALNQYNTYGAQTGGYSANAGGYGGFNELVSYKFTSSNYSGLWGQTFDNLEDYQYIINTTKGSFANSYYNAAATIMHAYGFQLLVDTYGDVPYSQALLGAGNLTPAYDKGSDVYKGLADELDAAIATIEAGLATTPQPASISKPDVMFQGDMTKWLKLANTLKLRLLLRGNGLVTFSNNNFSSAGFLTTDAMINPGYARDNNRQNPTWNSWVFSYSGSAGNKAWMPTSWMMSFYNGANLTDHVRGNACYYNFTRVQYPTTPAKKKTVYGDSISNQLGHEGTDVPACAAGSFWYSGSDRGGTTSGGSIGILKDPSAGMMALSAAESYFLQAEAAVRGLSISGATLPTAANAYVNGVTASFSYLLSDKANTLTVSGATLTADVNAYFTNNAGDHRADWSAASSTDMQIEAIITQKYIALNFINSQEGWNEYRRTGYPKVAGTGPSTTFASIVSQMSSSDRLPARILYPTTESAYNPANVPAGISVSTPIFWAKQ